MAAHRLLIDTLRAGLQAQADPGRAPAMQAYMKSALPFHGIAAPLRRQVTAAAVQQHPLADAGTLADTMRALWDEARFREERHVASELARQRPHRALLAQHGLALLPVFEHMIVTGAWWDHCDEISGEAIGPLLARHPGQMKPLLRRWAQGSDLWLRRTAILCQRGLKAEPGGSFDAELLYACILPSIGPASAANPWPDEFFLRKGIGWALRERSYDAPDEVRAFCAEYGPRLAPLTVREALKALKRRGGG